jgi:hypothetical protein
MHPGEATDVGVVGAQLGAALDGEGDKSDIGGEVSRGADLGEQVEGKCRGAAGPAGGRRRSAVPTSRARAWASLATIVITAAVAVLAHWQAAGAPTHYQPPLPIGI